MDGHTERHRDRRLVYKNTNGNTDMDTNWDADAILNTIAITYMGNHYYAYIDFYADRIAVRDGYGNTVAVVYANGNSSTRCAAKRVATTGI